MPYRIMILGTAVKKLITSINRHDAFTTSDVKHFANESYRKSNHGISLIYCKINFH